MQHVTYITYIRHKIVQFAQNKIGRSRSTAACRVYIHVEVDSSVEEKHQIITKDIANLRDELYRNFATKQDLAKTETKLILWAFVFWATQLGAIFAFLKFFMK